MERVFLAYEGRRILGMKDTMKEKGKKEENK